MKKGSQKGLHAIFTQNKNQTSKTREILSILSVVTGTLLVSWAITHISDTSETFVSTASMSSSLVLISSGLALVVAGGISGAYSLALRKIREENVNFESSTYKAGSLSLGDNVQRSTSQSDGPLELLQRGKNRQSRTLIVAIVEAVMLSVLGGWFIAEYRSNQFMREWVRTNIPTNLVFNLNPWILLLGVIGMFTLLTLRSRRSSRRRLDRVRSSLHA